MARQAGRESTTPRWKVEKGVRTKPPLRLVVRSTRWSRLVAWWRAWVRRHIVDDDPRGDYR